MTLQIGTIKKLRISLFTLLIECVRFLNNFHVKKELSKYHENQICEKRTQIMIYGLQF